MARDANIRNDSPHNTISLDSRDIGIAAGDMAREQQFNKDLLEATTQAQIAAKRQVERPRPRVMTRPADSQSVLKAQRLEALDALKARLQSLEAKLRELKEQAKEIVKDLESTQQEKKQILAEQKAVFVEAGVSDDNLAKYEKARKELLDVSTAFVDAPDERPAAEQVQAHRETYLEQARELYLETLSSVQPPEEAAARWSSSEQSRASRLFDLTVRERALIREFKHVDQAIRNTEEEISDIRDRFESLTGREASAEDDAHNENTGMIRPD